MRFILGVIATIGSFAASLGSQACLIIFLDESECPKSLVK